MMLVVSTGETSVDFYQATRRSILEDSHLHSRRRENLIRHMIKDDVMHSFLECVSPEGQGTIDPSIPVCKKAIFRPAFAEWRLAAAVYNLQLRR
jgi:hypothetical protein